MALYNVFPDIEALVSSAIRTSTGVGVYSSIPNQPTWPLITVKRIGGAPAERHHLDAAMIQVDVWGGAKGDEQPISKGSIQDLAQQTRVAVHEAEGTTVTVGSISGFITGVEDVSGLAWLPDPGTSRERYTMTFTVYYHG